jgi:hypothetical protein
VVAQAVEIARPEPEVERRRARLPAGWAPPLALGIAALGIDLVRIGSSSLWGDEVFTAQLASSPGHVFWNVVWLHGEANMVLYFLLLKGWLWLTAQAGILPTEIVVRAPSVVFAVGCVLVVYALGLRFVNRTVGVIAAALYLVNHVLLTMSLEARAYGLQALLICLSWYALLTAIGASRRRRLWWAAYVVAMILAIYAHLFSALVLASQLAAFAMLLALETSWRDRARAAVRELLVSVAIIGIAVSPMVVYAVRGGQSNRWIAPANLHELALLLWKISGHVAVFGALLAAAVGVGVVLTLVRRDRGLDRGSVPDTGLVVALLCWLTVPVAISYAVTQPYLNLHLFNWGYLGVVIPPLCLLAAMGVATPAARPLPRLALGLGLLASAPFAMLLPSSVPSQDFAGAVRWIEQHYQPGDGLVCGSWACRPGTAYYLSLDGGPASLTADSPQYGSWLSGEARPVETQAVAAFAAAHRRVFFVDAPLGGEAPAIGTNARLAREWLDGHDGLLDQISLPGPISVRLYADGSWMSQP